jgi:hypothetical protein
MTSVAYGCCVGSDEKFYRYVNRGASAARCIYARRNQTSIATAYNSMLNRARDDGFDVLILQHDDLEIADPDGEEKLVEALRDPDVALAGVAGGSVRGGLAWWNADPVGRVRWDGGVIDFGMRSGDVEMLDGCLLAFSRWAIENLRFAPRPGFHGYDGDICMRATATGRRVVVADLDVFHHTALGFDDEASHLDWLDADREFRERWEI